MGVLGEGLIEKKEERRREAGRRRGEGKQVGELERMGLPRWGKDKDGDQEKRHLD